VHKQAVADAWSRGDCVSAVEFINRALDKLLKQHEALKPIALPPFIQVAASWTGRIRWQSAHQQGKMMNDPYRQDVLTIWHREKYGSIRGHVLFDLGGQWAWQDAKGSWRFNALSTDMLESLVRDVARELERASSKRALYEEALQALIDTLDDRISRA
jgi:hypothetical protein